MLVPTPRLAYLVGLGALVLLPGVRQPQLLPAGLCYNLLLIALCLADSLATARLGEIGARRQCPPTFSLGVRNKITVYLHNHADRAVQVQVRDHLPAVFGDVPDPAPVTLGPGREAAVVYHVVPTRRGRFALGGLTARWRSRFGLFDRQAHWPLGEEARVYPNLQALRRYEMLQRAGRLLETGIRAARLRGAGTEFESLRDYQPDDEYRRIHWNATARRGKLTSMQYEVERSQTVVLAIDVGRLMTTRLGDLTRLDHAINTTLLLASVAAQLQDKVGLLVFAEEPLAYLPPRPGKAQMNRILEATFALEGRLIEPNYGSALRLLGLRQRKRSLVVLFTDLVDSNASQALLTYTEALRPAHLPIFVSFTDPTVLEMARHRPREPAELYERALATQVLAARRAALDQLCAHGVTVVDAPPEQASVELVNRYIELKVRMLL